jgi:CDGSH-type Zn-finger protein
VERPVVALCTCRRSQRMPWCDSTHKSVRRN